MQLAIRVVAEPRYLHTLSTTDAADDARAGEQSRAFNVSSRSTEPVELFIQHSSHARKVAPETATQAGLASAAAAVACCVAGSSAIAGVIGRSNYRAVGTASHHCCLPRAALPSALLPAQSMCVDRTVIKCNATSHVRQAYGAGDSVPDCCCCLRLLVGKLAGFAHTAGHACQWLAPGSGLTWCVVCTVSVAAAGGCCSTIHDDRDGYWPSCHCCACYTGDLHMQTRNLQVVDTVQNPRIVHCCRTKHA
jgi:hypothetical protein